MVIHNFPDPVTLTPGDAHRWKVRNVGGNTLDLPLWEDEGGLVFREVPVIPAIHYVYIPESESPVCRKITTAGSFLWRSMAQAPRWHTCSGITVMEFTVPGQWYETVSLPGDTDAKCPPVWHRYLSTDNPDAERLGDCGVRLNRLVSECQVAGFENYCEKAYIPSTVNGRKVNRADLPRGCCSSYLREFVAEQGTGLISMDFDLQTLERIEIPDDTVLAEPPHGIENTAWFHRQEGDIYLGGYYCGTRGKASDPVLRLKEGTVGILANARGGEGRQNVVIPDSLRYIGPHALRDVPGFQRQTFFTPISMEANPSGLSGKNVTPENLYRMGRCGHAAGYLIPEGYDPIAPRLTYENGWIAHYFYSNEYGSHIQYYLAVHLSTGMPVRFEKLDTSAGARPACWRRDRPTAHYFWAEDYLTHASALVRKGAPQPHDLKVLEKRWHAVIPWNLSTDMSYLLQQMAAKEAGEAVSRGNGGNKS